VHVDQRHGDDLEIALTEACANVVRHADALRPRRGSLIHFEKSFA
jgi:anti-sigma regulatory factor (Ser/Thr protein kinase)